ncbi:WG repeat-containing protein [Paenibacillus sp. DMB5]|uniref:WG repeat-containing protein n=1 Tax=Paenibacillus sp. DMB5 TaxID=1780103 RepID=UPI00076CEE88|nr:WG repeat-containing protein [Paenibacillus sp. DMB5]KUP21964.1 hypothetical protein AWJ19_05990 [Paenibacillus sp. DMB5]
MAINAGTGWTAVEASTKASTKVSASVNTIRVAGTPLDFETVKPITMRRFMRDSCSVCRLTVQKCTIILRENRHSHCEGPANVYNSAGKAGFINTAGKLVIGYQKYNHAFPFHEGVALVGISDQTGRKADRYGYINTSGKLLTKLIYTRESSPFNGGYAVGVTDIGTGYILSKFPT